MRLGDTLRPEEIKSQFLSPRLQPLGALKVLQKRALGGKDEVFVNMKGEPLRTYKHCFRTGS